MQNYARKWQQLLSERPFFALVSITVVSAIFFCFTAIARHHALKSNAFDLGLFTNALWNLTFEQRYVSSFKSGINLFADHISPILWAWAPIFRLFPAPETLLVIQSLTLASGAAAVFLIAKQYLGKHDIFTALVPLIYLTYGAVRAANMFDFHPETIILPAFLWAIAGLQSQKTLARIGGIFALLVGSMGKESAGPLLVGVGLSFTLGASPNISQRFTKKLGLGLMVTGVALFILEVMYLPQFFSTGSYSYLYLYKHLGDAPLTIIASPLTSPGIFFTHLLTLKGLKFILFLTAPLAFFSWFSWRHYPAFAVPMLILLLPDDPQRLGTSFHYGIEPAVGLLWALSPGYAVFCKLLAPRLSAHRKFSATEWGCGTIIVMSSLYFVPSIVSYKRYFKQTDQGRWLHTELFPCIDPKASLATQSNLAPHLALRPWASHLPLIDTNEDKPVNCVIFDGTANQWPMAEVESETLLKNRIEPYYKEIFTCKSTKVFQHPSSPHACLSCKPDCS